MKWLTALFALFIILVIVFADLGYLGGPIRALASFPNGDKVGHFLLIGVLSFLVILSSIQSFPARNPLLVTIITGLILALLFTVEEASQGPLNNRDASLTDLAANYAGILVFGSSAWILNKMRGSKAIPAQK